jgi:hypothetical protein
MGKFGWGLIVWVGVWGGLLLALELAAIFWKACPWPTLSWESWELQKKVPISTILIVGGLAVLAGHVERVKNVQEGE